MIRLVPYVAVAALAWFITAEYHITKAGILAAKQQQAWKVSNESIRIASGEWEKKLIAANARPADVVTERVFIKASPLPAANCEQLHDGAATVRVELNESSVRGVERVTIGAEAQYRECSHRLNAWQDAAERNGWQIE